MEGLGRKQLGQNRSRRGPVGIQVGAAEAGKLCPSLIRMVPQVEETSFHPFHLAPCLQRLSINETSEGTGIPPYLHIFRVMF